MAKGMSKWVIWTALGMLIVIMVFAMLLYFQQYGQRILEPTIGEGRSGGAGGGGEFSQQVEDENIQEATAEISMISSMNRGNKFWK